MLKNNRQRLGAPVAVARKVDAIIIDGVKLIEYGINADDHQIREKNSHLDRKSMFQQIVNDIYSTLRIAVDGMGKIIYNFLPKF